LPTSISKKNALYKKCYQQTTHQFQPSTNFTEINMGVRRGKETGIFPPGNWN